MSQLPMGQMSRQEQQELMNQLYLLLGKQVKSYHKHRHMGDNSSVSTELAQELMASLEYTWSLAGGIAGAGNLEEKLRTGQDLLESRLRQAKSLLTLVNATAPSWQTECRWDALRCIEGYLAAYDPLHLAHRIPEMLFYPTIAPLPDGVAGIDHCLFYLNAMWIENQIMAGFDEEELDQFWNLLSQDVWGITLNQCEQLLINALGKMIAGPQDHALLFSGGELERLEQHLRSKTTEELRSILNHGLERLCRQLDLTGHAAEYARAIVPQLQLRLENALQHHNLQAIFI